MGLKTKKDVGVVVRQSGVSFRVWAPFADAVGVIGSFNDWNEQLLIKEGDGYWSGFVQGAVPGQEYKFNIHLGKEVLVRNDPRAKHFTTSAGTSVISGNNFDWGTDNFEPPPIEEQVIYELHVGTFNRSDPAINGTFYDLIAKLDYLKELGINMVELMPVGTMMMDRGWGYAIDYIFAVESLYGGRRGLMEFVKAAHRLGIGVILDVVYNHFGPDTNLDLWDFDGWHEEGYGGIYFYNDWRAETPWGKTRPDFGRPEVRQYIIDNVTMWLHDCHVDGLRLDSTIYIRNVKGLDNDPEHDLPEAWQLLQQINTVARKIKPSVITIAEDIAANDYLTKPVNEGGAGFDAQWELGFPAALKQALASNDPDNIDFTGLLGQLTRGYNDNMFERVIYADSHDSAANGSARLIEVIGNNKPDSLFVKKQSLLAATIVLSAPGIPMLFQGEEFLERGSFNDWQQLDWRKAERFRGIIKAYSHLIALRKNYWHNTYGLCGSSIDVTHVDQENKVLSYHRTCNGGPGDDCIIILNFGKREIKDYRINWPSDGIWRLRFCSSWHSFDPEFKPIAVADVKTEDGLGSLLLPASSGLIFSQDP
jgi:1,4-alpha-glucan branching enzyme